MFRFFLFKLGQFFAHALPLNYSYTIACFIADLQYYLSYTDRKAVHNNFKVITGSEITERFHPKEVFRNFSRYLVEFFRMARYLNDDYVAENVQIEHLDRLQAVLKKGKGAILVTGHIGNWELGAAILSKCGYPSMVIALPHKENSVNNFFNQQREAAGLEVIPTKLAFRRYLEALRQNKIVGVIADRDFTESGKLLEFLGKKALIPKGAAVMSYRTGTDIVPVFFVRQKNGSFLMTIKEPIVSPQKDNGRSDEENILFLMRSYKNILEQKIRENPEQWIMFRQFWVDEQRAIKAVN